MSEPAPGASMTAPGDRLAAAQRLIPGLQAGVRATPEGVMWRNGATGLQSIAVADLPRFLLVVRDRRHGGYSVTRCDDEDAVEREVLKVGTDAGGLPVDQVLQAVLDLDRCCTVAWEVRVSLTWPAAA